MIVPFHKVSLAGNESAFICDALTNNSWATENSKTLRFLSNYFHPSKIYFTSSCSAALDVAIRALGISNGDEVIIPAFGYVAVANAVSINGATPVFADVLRDNGNIDIRSIENRITSKTKAVIAIHYGGNPIDLQDLLALCNEKKIYLIEDAAQAFGAHYNGKPLGLFGHIGCISFDYMKNISCGQGGLLIVNDQQLVPRVQVIYDNGTNRQDMIDGKVQHFEWVGNGNNYKINPLATYFLEAQIQKLQEITQNRLASWENYYEQLLQVSNAGHIALPRVSAGHNGHIFYVILKTEEKRNQLRTYLNEKGVFAECHYTSLPASVFGKQFTRHEIDYSNANMFCNCLLRLPLWNTISGDEIKKVTDEIVAFFYINRHV